MMNDVVLKKRVCHGCNIVKKDGPEPGLFQRVGESLSAGSSEGSELLISVIISPMRTFAASTAARRYTGNILGRCLWVSIP